MNYYINVFRKYAEFNGRARRAEYWYFLLFHMLVLFSIIGLGFFFESGIFFGLYALYALAAFVPSLAVIIRRMHDVGKSGWYCLIPIYNLILALTPGETGPNEYGPDPKGGDGAFVAYDPHLLDN
jgi:uncharacterized membrane protein YhaH (DUF805 family)